MSRAGRSRGVPALRLQILLDGRKLDYRWVEVSQAEALATFGKEGLERARQVAVITQEERGDE